MDHTELQKELDDYNETTTQHHTSASELVGRLKDGFSVFLLNIRSLNKHYNELVLLLHDLNWVLDVVVLTETWTDESTSFPHIEGFDIFNTISSKNRADGVVVYVREELRASSIEHSVTDCNCLQVNIIVEGQPYSLFCVYRSPSYTDPSPFLNSFTNLLNHNTHHRKVIVAGDFNINILETPSKHPQANEYLNRMTRCGFRSCVNIPTRVTRETESCIDHIFIKYNNRFTTMTLENTITDHYPTIIHLPTSNTHVQNGTQTTPRLGYSINYKRLKQHLQTETWTPVYNNLQPYNLFTSFYSILSSHVTNNTNFFRRKKNIKPIKPWITRGLIESIHTRDRMNLRRKQEPENIEIARQYRFYRNTLTTLIQKTKDTYYKQQIHSAGHNKRKIWDVIKNATDNKKQKKQTINEIKVNNSMIQVSDNPEVAVNVVNKHFATIGNNMANHLLRTQNTTMHNIIHDYTPPQQTVHSFFLSPVTEDEVISAINSLNINSAPGPDNIDNRLLKEIKFEIATPLTYLINRSFELGHFPNELKKSVIIPLFKSGDRTILTNYRPISLTCNMAKIFEKLVKKKLMKYLENNRLISNHQFGFRDGRGTHDALFELTKYITNSLDESKKCIAVFLDLAKAFDTVSHDLLLKKLEAVGIRGVAYDWFTSYLTNRTQTVKINQHVSSETVIEFGVPQGTVLGPILYLIYANDLCNLPINGRIISYADDTVLLVHADTWERALQNAEVELGLVIKCLNQNLLTLNIDKTKFLTFALTGTVKPNNQSLRLHNYSQNQSCDCLSIEQTNQVNYLGLIVDDRLHWDKHATQLTLRLRKLIYKFVQLRRILTPNILKSIYYALVESTLSYGILVWGGTNITYISPVIQIQKLILRIINFKIPRYPSKLLFKEYEVLSLRQIYISKILIFIRKHPEHTTTISHSHNTRQKQTNLSLPRMSTGFAQKHAMYLAPRIYNKVPIEIKQIHTLSKYKLGIKKWLIHEHDIDSTEHILRTNHT